MTLGLRSSRLAHRGAVRAALVAAGVALALGACASAPRIPAGEAPARVGFSFATDTFAFPNQVRAIQEGPRDLYANYCFVLARGLRQFHAFARFDPGAPRLDHDAYVRRVRAVAARAPWSSPLPDAERIVIPGYPNLREFSRGQERAVKQGLGSRFWTLVHWTNWRVTLPVGSDHQEDVARAVLADLGSGRLVQLLVTNFPKDELNHTVVAYDARETPTTLELIVWDPNDPVEPGRVSFDRQARHFIATRLYATEEYPIRVFRMYYSRVF